MSYPLSLPSSRQISSCRINAVDIVGSSISPFTGVQQVYAYTGQFWEVDVNLRPMDREEAEQWITFFMKLRGSYGTFLLGDPNGATPRGAATGAPLVNGASQTGDSLITDGWTAGVTGILKAGDYIQLGSAGASRLYKVLDDVTSDGSGNATLNIWPNLRSSPANNAAITVTNCKSVFRLSTPNTWDIREAQIYGINFGAREAL